MSESRLLKFRLLQWIIRHIDSKVGVTCHYNAVRLSCCSNNLLVFLSFFLFVLDGLHQRDPAGHCARPSVSLAQALPHAAPEVDGAVVLIGLRGDLHLLHDELQQTVLLLQHAWHLLHPTSWVVSVCSPLGGAHVPETSSIRLWAAAYLCFCFWSSVCILEHCWDLACTRLHTSSFSSTPVINWWM